MKNVVITIARHFGSGGKTIGKMLSEDLGISYYEHEIIEMASEESGIAEELFNQADEKLKRTPLFFGKSHSGEYKGKLLAPDSDEFVSDHNLFNYQAKVIKDLAAQESCIIIGRCADYVLKDNPDVIRLFFYAPLEDCIRRVVDQNGISAKEAEKKIAKIDKYRADYYKYYTGNAWNDARNYDFCLDTSSMSYEKLVAVVKDIIKIYQE